LRQQQEALRQQRQTALRPHVEAGASAWEYAWLTSGTDDIKQTAGKAAEWGADGWELVCVTPIAGWESHPSVGESTGYSSSTSWLLWVFKRPRPLL
jgi:hypothetical protein